MQDINDDSVGLVTSRNNHLTDVQILCPEPVISACMRAQGTEKSIVDACGPASMHGGALHTHQIENLTKPVIDIRRLHDNGFYLGKSTTDVAVEFDLLVVHHHHTTSGIDDIGESHAPDPLRPEVAESNGDHTVPD